LAVVPAALVTAQFNVVVDPLAAAVNVIVFVLAPIVIEPPLIDQLYVAYPDGTVAVFPVDPPVTAVVKG
jgi:hypothetical protein